jgi:hypothetical protein
MKPTMCHMIMPRNHPNFSSSKIFIIKCSSIIHGKPCAKASPMWLCSIPVHLFNIVLFHEFNYLCQICWYFSKTKCSQLYCANAHNSTVQMLTMGLLQWGFVWSLWVVANATGACYWLYLAKLQLVVSILYKGQFGETLELVGDLNSRMPIVLNKNHSKFDHIGLVCFW